MDLKELFTEDRAVSPVIGVILMVAITVILAAVIGAFVLGLGGETQETPQASLSFELNESGENVTIEHRGGDTLDLNDVNATIDGSSVGELPTDEDLSTGETFKITEETPSSGDRIVIIHNPTDGQIASRTL